MFRLAVGVLISLVGLAVTVGDWLGFALSASLGMPGWPLLFLGALWVDSGRPDRKDRF